MAAAAPGFRAMPSAAPRTALPCPRAHSPEAMAMENPAVTGTQILPPPAAPPPAPWANIGSAQNISAIARKISFVFNSVTPYKIRSPEVVAFLAGGREASHGKRHKAG